MTEEWQRGDIIQIGSNHQFYSGELMVVTEAKPFGAQGYIALAYPEPFELARLNGLAYVRVAFEEGRKCGHVAWLVESNFRTD